MKKCVTTMKETKKQEKRRTRKNIFDGRKPFLYKVHTKNWGKQSQLLQVSSQRFWASKQVNGCQGDDFTSVGTQTGAIKLPLAGTQDWWRRFPPLLGY